MPRERSRGRRRSGVFALNRGSSPHVRRSSLPLNMEGGSSFFAGRPAAGGGRDAVAEALMFPLASVQGSFEEGPPPAEPAPPPPEPPGEPSPSWPSQTEPPAFEPPPSWPSPTWWPQWRRSRFPV